MNYVTKVLLSNFLKEYISNFEKSELLLYSGNLNMKAVHLQECALNAILVSMRLPLSVTRASIAELQLNVPWASLSTSPISVCITGLRLSLALGPIVHFED
jgi:hypothetical protein